MDFGFFVRRPRFAIGLAVLALVACYLFVPSMPVALYPSVARPKISVSCTYPGANAREVMNTIAGPMEDVVNGVEGMEYMTSSCLDNGSYSLTVHFQVGYDRDLANMKVQAKVQQALSLLPQEVKNTGVTVQSGSTEELGVLMVRSAEGRLTREEVVDYVFGVINPAILRVNGIGKSTVQDNKVAMRVWLDADRMASLGIDTAEVVAAIKAQNVQASLGSVGASPTADPTSKVIALISKGRLDSAEDFENIVVRTEDGGGLVRLGDIGRIDKGLQAYNYSALYEETPAVFIQIYQLPGADMLGTMNALKRQLKELESSFPGDLTCDMTYDSSRYIEAALYNVGKSILIAVLLALVAVGILLRSWRAAVVTAITLPVPFALTMAVVALSGMCFSLIVMYSLLISLALMIVFSAVMIRKSVLLGAETAVKSLTAGVIAAAGLVALAMIPIGMIDGVPGVMYRQFAIVLGVAALSAGANALILVPPLAKRLVGCRPQAPAAVTVRSGFGYISGTLVCLALGLAAWGLFGQVAKEFIPDEDMGYIYVDCRTAEGRTMPLTEDLMKRIYRDVRGIGGIEKSATLLGGSVCFSSTENNAKMCLILEDWDKRGGLTASELANRIRKIVSGIPETLSYVIEPPSVPGFGSMNGITVRIQSTEDNDPVRFANEMQKIRAYLARSPLAEFVTTGNKADSPHLRVNVDREKCELMNVPMSTLYTAMQHHLGSVYVNDVNLGTQVNRVTVMSDWAGRSTPERVRQLYVRSTKGEMVPVDTLATFEEELGVSECYLFDQYLYYTMQFVPKVGVSESDAIAEIQRLCAEVMPRGYRQGWAGLTYEQFKSRGDTALLVILAILAAYLVMVARTESTRKALNMLVPSVSAVFGAVLIHFLAGVPMSLYSQFAMILLVVVTAAGSLLAGADDGWSVRTLPSALFLVAVLPFVVISGPAAVGSRSFGIAMAGGFAAYMIFQFVRFRLVTKD